MFVPRASHGNADAQSNHLDYSKHRISRKHFAVEIFAFLRERFITPRFFIVKLYLCQVSNFFTCS